MTSKKTDPDTPLPELSDAEKRAAQKEGVKEAHKEGAKEYTRYHDGEQPGAPPEHPFLGSDEIMQYADLLELSAEALAERVDGDHPSPIPEEKVAGLLALERNGKNRTDWVKVLLDRLPVDSVYDVPRAGGPAYTNDTTPVSALDKR